MEERRTLRNARRLLHRVGDDDDAVVLPQLVDQLLDLGRGDRIERRAGLVHQDHLRVDGNGAGDAQALLLAARQAGAGLVQAILDLFPQAGLLRGSSARSPRGPPSNGSGRGCAGRRRRSRRSTWGTDLASGTPCRRGPAAAPRRARVVDVLVIDGDLARHAANRNRVVHAVDAAQERRLAAAGRTDEGHHAAIGMSTDTSFSALLVAVIDVDISGTDLGRGKCGSHVSVHRRLSVLVDHSVHDSLELSSYQRLSNFLRSQIAAPFITKRNTSRTMMAAAVLDLKAVSGRSDQR